MIADWEIYDVAKINTFLIIVRVVAKCLDLSSFEGGSYILCKAENQVTAGPAPGRMHRATCNRLAGAPGQNADNALQHRHDSAIYCGVGEGEDVSSQGENTYPG